MRLGAAPGLGGETTSSRHPFKEGSLRSSGHTVRSPRARSKVQTCCLLVPHAENFVTALVPSDTACFASSPGSTSRIAVCTSRLVSVCFLFSLHKRPASLATLSKVSVTKLFMMLIDFFEIVIFGCTCLRTRLMYVLKLLVFGFFRAPPVFTMLFFVAFAAARAMGACECELSANALS